jgi:crcB protein
MLLKQILLVGLGGAVGSIFRYLVSHFTCSDKDWFNFPLATFSVNMVGCLLIGILMGLCCRYSLFSGSMKLLLIIGFCGGFTTFSSFSLENLQLYESGHIFTLLVYILSSVLLGILFVWLGIFLTKCA